MKARNCALIVGFGSAGRKHALSLSALGLDLIVATGQPPEVVSSFENDHGLRKIIACRKFDVETIVKMEPTVGIVCDVSSDHYKSVMFCLDLGLHVYVEKPITLSSSETLKLLNQAKRKGRVLQAGYMLRHSVEITTLKKWSSEISFSSPLFVKLEVGQNLDLWRPSSTARKSYSFKKAEGGGALFDLSHEIDLAIELFGMPESVFATKTSLDLGDERPAQLEGSVSILLSYKRDLVVFVSIDLYHPCYKRTVEVKNFDYYICWDHAAGLFWKSSKTKAKNGEIIWDIDRVDVDPRNEESWQHLFKSSLEVFLGRARSNLASKELAELYSRELQTSLLIDACQKSIESGDCFRLAL